MDRRIEVEVLCKEFIKKHNPDVKFAFNQRKTFAGVTKFTRDGIQIELSEHFVNNPEIPLLEVLNAFLHELAHSIVGRSHGHDALWKETALNLGCDATRTCKQFSRGPFVVHCKRCNTKYFLHRSPKHNMRRCSQCGSIVLVERTPPDGA